MEHKPNGLQGNFPKLQKEIKIMATAKVLNYDAKALEALQTYTGQDNEKEVSALAGKLGKTKSSIVSKLSQMNLYVKSEGKAGSVAKPKYTRKARAVKIVSMAENLCPSDVDTLAKSSIRVLEAFEASLTQNVKADDTSADIDPELSGG